MALGGTPPSPFTYDIDSRVSPTFMDLCHNSYNVTIIDGNACIQIVSVILGGTAEL